MSTTTATATTTTQRSKAAATTTGAAATALLRLVLILWLMLQELVEVARADGASGREPSFCIDTQSKPCSVVSFAAAVRGGRRALDY